MTEAREKQLEEALLKIKEAVCGDRRPENDFRNTEVRIWVANTIDSALSRCPTCGGIGKHTCGTGLADGKQVAFPNYPADPEDRPPLDSED